MALGSRLMGIQLWFLFLSIICAFVTAWFTFLTSKKIFKLDNNAVLAAIFVLVLPTPTLAESTFFVYENIMTPSALVFPMLVIACYHFFANHKLVIPIFWVGIASFFQVLYGLTTGLLFLGTFFLYHLRFDFKYFPWKKLIFSVFVFGLFASASLIPYFSASVSSSMTTTEFVDIVAHFRNPHHYVPSYFPVQTWVLAICFFGAGYLAFLQNKSHYWNPESVDTNDTREADKFYSKSLIFSSLILFGFALGYVFVEIFPSRLVTTAQTFRYVILLKWIVCIYFGMRLSMLFALHPVPSFVYMLIERISVFASFPDNNPKSKIRKSLLNWLQSNRGVYLNTTIQISALILSLIFLSQGETILLLLTLFVLIALLIFQDSSNGSAFIPFSNYINVFLLIITIGLAISPFISQRYLPTSIDNLLSKVYPKYDFKYKYDDDLNELSKIIKEKTRRKSNFRYSAIFIRHSIFCQSCDCCRFQIYSLSR